MNKRNKTPSFSLMARKIIKERPRMVAIESAKFFKDSFVNGGFTDANLIVWKNRVGPMGGKKTLIGYRNTANLMQSIRTLEESEKQVRTGTDLIYSEIHNEGGSITVTPQMKRFFWAKYYEFAGLVSRSKSGSSRNKTLNSKAEYCHNLALMKVGAKIKIPKRQYIGESKTLNRKFEEWFSAEIEKLNEI